MISIEGVTFCTTDSTLSPSPLEMLHRHIVDHHHYQLYAPFAHLDDSHTGSGPPAPYYMWKHLYPIFSTSLVNSLHSTHVYLLSISEYGHAQSKYHMFSFPCHMFVLLFHMLLLIIPHAISKSSTCSLPLVTFHVSVLPYISIEYLSCISSVSNIKSSSSLLSHFASEVYSLCPKSRAHRWQVAQHIHWGLALICQRYCTWTLYFPIWISTLHLFCPKRIR